MAPRNRVSPAVIKAYHFLIGRENAGQPFTIDELAAASGWKASSAKTVVGKKLGTFVVAAPSGLRVAGIATYTESEFVRLLSQRQEVAADPRNPRLPPELEALLRKARESALLGLQLYNNPTTVFKTEGFIVLLVIAWTALLHAILKRRGADCHYKDANGQVLLVNGDPKMWELRECLRAFFQEQTDPIRTNLEFFIELRNKIEHRYVPAIDPHVAGECQAMLLNFDDLLTAEFGPYFGIRESLTVPLQTSTIRSDEQGKVLKKLQAGHFEDVKQFIDNFRANLGPTIGGDQRFSFRVFLVPKVGNHRATSDVAIEFVKLDSADADLVGRQIVAIKEKQVAVHNLDMFKPSVVAREVAKRLGKRFTVSDHTLAWKKYGVRPSLFATTGCDSRYCAPDPVHQDFVYTRAWIDLLVRDLSDAEAYEALQRFRPTTRTSSQP